VRTVWQWTDTPLDQDRFNGALDRVHAPLDQDRFNGALDRVHAFALG
jgi:hypothetical protein